MIALAINIAVMGLLLVDGVRASSHGDAAVASRLAAGEVHMPEALAHGFGQVMLYAGASVSVLAVASSLVFAKGPPNR